MRESISARDIVWNNIESPSNEELAEFVREAHLSPLDAEFIVRDHQRSEIAVRQDYILILLHVPVFDKQLRVTSGVPLYFLITTSAVYTLQYEPLIALKKIYAEFADNKDQQDEYFGDSSLNLALHIIGQLNASSFRKIGRLAKHLEIAEDAVFQGNERKMVEEVAILSRDVLDFRKIIRPQLNLFSAMPDQPFSDDVKSQWRRLAGQISQMWEVLESLHESSKELRSTNDSLLQHKENELLRMLTIYSIIAIPVWIFVSAFDPRSSEANLYDHLVFWGVLIVLSFLLVYIFIRGKRRRVV